jgi:hypothetical protein
MTNTKVCVQKIRQPGKLDCYHYKRQYHFPKLHVVAFVFFGFTLYYFCPKNSYLLFDNPLYFFSCVIFITISGKTVQCRSPLPKGLEFDTKVESNAPGGRVWKLSVLLKVRRPAKRSIIPWINIIMSGRFRVLRFERVFTG